MDKTGVETSDHVAMPVRNSNLDVEAKLEKVEGLNRLPEDTLIPNREINVKYDLNELVSKLLSGEIKTEEEFRLFTAQQSQEVLPTSLELFRIFTNPEYVITDKFRVLLVSLENLQLLNRKVNNSALALKLFSQYGTYALLEPFLKNIFSSLISFEHNRKLLKKQYLVPKHRFLHVVLEFQESAHFKKSSELIKIRTISLLAESGINPTFLISALDNVTVTLNEQDDDFQLQIFTSLIRRDASFLFQFLTHLDTDRLRVAVSKQLRNMLTANEIYKFFNWVNPNPHLSSAGLFINIIRPVCENFLEWNDSLSDLLLILPLLVEPSNNFNQNQIIVKLKSQVRKPGHLNESLRDPAIPLLQGEIQVLKDNVDTLEASLSAAVSENSKLLASNFDLSEQVSNLESKQLKNKRDSTAYQDAKVRQLQIDIYRNFLPLFDFLGSTATNSEVIGILDEIGIEVLGITGKKMRWNSNSCESLTGEELLEGIVVRQGYSWFNGKEVIPIRRVLLKPI